MNDRQPLIETLRAVNAAAATYVNRLPGRGQNRPTAELYDTIQLTRAILAQVEKTAVAGVDVPKRLRIDYAPLFEIACARALSVCFEAPDHDRAVLYDPRDESRHQVLAWAPTDRCWYRVPSARDLGIDTGST